MDTDRPTDEMLQRMLAAVVGAFGSHGQVDRLVETARAEAEAEVKDLLKAAIKATLLQRAVSRLEAGDAPAAVIPDPLPPKHQAEFADGPTGCYVYGIVRAGQDGPSSDIVGVDPSAPLQFVSYGQVQALTSTISLAEFGPEAMAERVKNLGWVEEKVRAHDAVLKEMLAAGPVVPCRFCTVLRGEDDLQAVLARHADELAATLQQLDGKKEWGVKVLSASPDTVSPAAQALPSGKAYFLQKKRDELARAEAARAARDAADACHEALSATAAAAARLAIGERHIAREGGDVVLNGAYLVADVSAVAFHKLVASLAERYSPLGLTLEITGPWPPYNFVSLDLSLDPPPATNHPAEPEAAA